VKGDKCDFLHPRRLNPRGEQTTRVCDFFLTPQGCIKGNNCDFIHPRVPPTQHYGASSNSRSNARVGGSSSGGSDTRVCQYYLTPAGCNKGNSCSFLHPTGRAAQEALANVSRSSNNGNNAGKANNNTSKKAQRCDFYFSASGCKKGDSCPFSHEQRRGGNKESSASSSSSSHPRSSGVASFPASRKPRICGFHNTDRGCIKGESCEFIHIKDKTCDFWLSEQGCKKGDWCDFKHSKDQQGNPSTEGEDARITQATQKTQTETEERDENNY